MKINDRISAYRVGAFAGIFLATICLNILLGVYYGYYLDEILVICIVNLIFFFCFLFQLEFERKQGNIGNNTETNFSRITIGYLISCGIIAASIFLPEFYKPMILLPVIMCAFGNFAIAINSSIYLMLIFGLLSGCSMNEFVVYGIMIILGCIFTKALEKEKYRIYITGIYFFLCVMVPALFYYWTYKQIQIRPYLYGIVEGLMVALFVLVIYSRIKEETEEEVTYMLMDLVQDSYPLVVEVKGYSQMEYHHCKEVSDICYRCANHLGYNKELCCAAGFYYRIGRWEGEPFIENGIKKAQQYCFPIQLIEILSEYYGEQKKPSTPESALVHIVDALMKKLELLNKDVGQSSWNKEIIIYQTLNEFSSTGLYDESGMSMNQFLKLREYLVKEEKLV